MAVVGQGYPEEHSRSSSLMLNVVFSFIFGVKIYNRLLFPPLLMVIKRKGQGESVNILLNFTQFFETRIEYRFQIFTAHSCDFLLPS
ncbi:hypothetical protein, partial [Aeromonas caviae]|uniref:hypothetical protein n=1 Tax=Aeromonas caviae TaxID=648 RepID=UPI001CC70BEE